MDMVDYRRQIELFNPAHHHGRRVVVVGCGNTGSHATLALTRLGLSEFVLVDFDEVEEHNLSSQAYPDTSVGLSKVATLRNEMKRVNSMVRVETITLPIQEALTDGHLELRDSDILLVAVDTMDTRYELLEMIRDWGGIVYDSRVGGGQVEVHQGNVEQWATTLTREADTDSCGGRFISYTSYVAAGLIASTVKRVLTEQPITRSVYMSLDTFEILKRWVLNS